MAAGCAVVVVAATTQAQTGATPASQPTEGTSATASKSSSSSGKTVAHKKTRKKRTPKTANWRKHGQQKIDPQRARAIQDALIREHYLQGQSSGIWDDASEKAMQRYQADNGWQSKSTPDARALIKLGLGPDQGKLLNPDSAMTSYGVATKPVSNNAASTTSQPASVTSTSPAPTSSPAATAPVGAEAANPSPGDPAVGDPSPKPSTGNNAPHK